MKLNNYLTSLIKNKKEGYKLLGPSAGFNTSFPSFGSSIIITGRKNG
ncbi:hypothetical protein J4414_02360 [Candidatus Woesearchaeota archaeon]|nr:hypothetical protein [Candidatus Woesearchaeota archaeon]